MKLKKKFLFISLFFLIILITLLTLAEGMLRFVGLGNPILYNTNLSYRYYLKPNQKIKRFNSSIVINNLSLRSDENWYKELTQKKILFMGDSVTYGGSYVDNHEIFSSLVCEKLNNNQKKYLCGNAAVNGYGADNIKNRIIYDDIDYEDFLIVTLIGDSGFRSLVNIGSTPSHSQMPKYFPAIKEFTYWSLWKIMSQLRRNDWWFEGEMDTNYNVAEKSLQELKKTLHEESNKNKKILVILHPNKEQFNEVSNVNKKNLTIKYNLLKKIYFSDSNIQVIDLLNYLPRDNLNEIYYDDVHLSKMGHQFIAELIYSIIKKIN